METWVPKPAVCPSWLILSHTHTCLSASMGRGREAKHRFPSQPAGPSACSSKVHFGQRSIGAGYWFGKPGNVEPRITNPSVLTGGCPTGFGGVEVSSRRMQTSAPKIASAASRSIVRGCIKIKWPNNAIPEVTPLCRNSMYKGVNH